jgi:4'-phosphopantetheinyl transferase
VTTAWLARGEADLPDGLDWLGPWERDRLDRMRFTKRRMEYLVSRLAGKEAVGAVAGVEPASVEIRNRPGGAPYALVCDASYDATVTLSDRAGWAVGAVSQPGVDIGVDLELIEPRSERFVADYLTAAEQEAVDKDRDFGANLIWAGKEAALKVLRTGLRRATKSVEVSFERDGTGWRPLVVTAIEGRRFDGWWRRFDHFLLVVVADRTIPIPTSLEEPPRLVGARPMHSWLKEPRIDPSAR